MKAKLFSVVGVLVVLIALVGRHIFINPAEAQHELLSDAEQKLSYEFDYERLIMLDAERLFEQGMLEGYEAIIPKLNDFTEPAKMTEVIPDGTNNYLIEVQNKQYYLFDEDIAQKDVYEGWALATYTLFHVVNLQLVETDYKLYALYGGNDLSGVFMTEEEVIERRRAFKDKHSEWPYVPTMEHPDFGFPGGGDDFWHGLGHGASSDN